MHQSAITQAVATFKDARSTMQPIEALEATCRPANMDEGYAIQDAFIAEFARPVIGWKVGATNQAALELFGIDQPFLGPIFEGTIYTAPVELPAADFHHCCVESEFAFRIARDLPAPDGQISTEAVRAAVAEVIPAFELISPRFTSVPKGDGPSAVADCGIGGGLVIGAPHPGLDGLDLVNHAVSLAVDGETIAEGTGALVMGDPIEALAWTARKLGAQGKQLRAGDFVTTGTCTGVQFVEPGKLCRADFGALGSVEVKFTT
ncbi:MAG: fumarylacetoacetate hydrolase family protein [Pseudomonadota bacterium]